MADLYLSRKLSCACSMASSPNCYLTSPTIGSKISRASVATVRGDENDVEQLEMLLEVGSYCTNVFFLILSIFYKWSLKTYISISFTGILHTNRQHFEQINNSYLLATSFLVINSTDFFFSKNCSSNSQFLWCAQLREYVQDTDDYISIQVTIFIICIWNLYNHNIIV